MPSLVLIRGLPGSGKSTYAKTYYPDYLHFEADQYFVNSEGIYTYDKSKIQEAHKQCYENTVNGLLSYNDKVVVSNTFTTLKELKPYYNLRLFVLDLNITICECKGNFASIHNVPEETLVKMRNRWQIIPSNWEVNQ